MTLTPEQLTMAEQACRAWADSAASFVTTGKDAMTYAPATTLAEVAEMVADIRALADQLHNERTNPYVPPVASDEPPCVITMNIKAYEQLLRLISHDDGERVGHTLRVMVETDGTVKAKVNEQSWSPAIEGASAVVNDGRPF